ncbi:MAG TPA: ferric reductase-like transmembrane domain-containing protein, partial [Phycisphaerae bacterium]
MKDTQFAKIVVFTSSLVPLALLIWDKSTGELGADPVNYVTRTTGILALVFLLLSLTVTPLRRITGKNYWSLFRRMLGLYAFFYAAIHMLCFVAWYQNWSLSGVITETIKRPYIMFGMGAFLLMVPLAATSTVWAIKKMGNKKW